MPMTVDDVLQQPTKRQQLVWPFPWRRRLILMVLLLIGTMTPRVSNLYGSFNDDLYGSSTHQQNVFGSYGCSNWEATTRYTHITLSTPQATTFMAFPLTDTMTCMALPTLRQRLFQLLNPAGNNLYGSSNRVQVCNESTTWMKFR